MKNVELDFFPGGVKRAVTFSYDDGRIEDMRLVEMFNRYKLRATFHLCCPEWRSRYEFLRRDGVGFVDDADYAALYSGHEISCHLASHPFTYKLPRQAAIAEIMRNKSYLEALCGYPVRGLSYPFGSHTEETVLAFEVAGMEYGRTAAETDSFGLPTDLMRWDATCHHSRALPLVEGFTKLESFEHLKLFNIWGHSYEFYTEKHWSEMEHLCEAVAGKDNVWYATYIEIADYIRAMKSLKFTADMSAAYNPSAIPVWIAVDDEPREIPSGATVVL